MPHSSILVALATLNECISAPSHRVIQELARRKGHLGSSDAFAVAAGFRNRHELRRALIADNLPCLEDLATWVRVVGWVNEAHESGVRLSHRALSLNKDPRSFYRMARRVTGYTWGEVLRRGPDWVISEFVSVLQAGRRDRLKAAV